MRAPRPLSHPRTQKRGQPCFFLEASLQTGSRTDKHSCKHLLEEMSICLAPRFAGPDGVPCWLYERRTILSNSMSCQHLPLSKCQPINNQGSITSNTEGIVLSTRIQGVVKCSYPPGPVWSHRAPLSHISSLAANCDCSR